MSRINEVIELLHDMRKTHRMQPLGWGKMIEESFTKVFELLESEPEPTEPEKSPMMSECWLVHPSDDIDCEQCPNVGECREVRAEIDRLTAEKFCTECGCKMSLWCERDVKERMDAKNKELQADIKAKDKALCKAMGRITALSLKEGRITMADLYEQLKAKDGLLEKQSLLMGQLQCKTERLKELLSAVESVYPGRFKIEQALKGK